MEKVKVELLIPESVNRAIKVICETFMDDPHDYMVRAIEGGIESDLSNNFEAFYQDFSKRIQDILKSQL